MSKVVLNQDDCTECGSCADICPEVFAMDMKSGKAKVIKPEGGSSAEIDEAISTCPAQCISKQ